LTLIVICKQCGAKNNFTRVINFLKENKITVKSTEPDVFMVLNQIKPRCGNCFIDMTPQQNDTKVMN